VLATGLDGGVAHLHDPYAAAVLLAELYIPGTVEGSGALPPAFDLPPNAIP
jgi:hypothetical protein